LQIVKDGRRGAQRSARRMVVLKQSSESAKFVSRIGKALERKMRAGDTTKLRRGKNETLGGAEATGRPFFATTNPKGYVFQEEKKEGR